MSSLRWDEVRAITRRPVEGLSARDIPNAPGVYVWFREGEPVYVGEARGAGGLRGRLRAHLATGVDLSRSTLRASVAVKELGISRAHARSRPSHVTPDQVEAVNRWLRSCDLGWVTCDTADGAHELEARLRAEWLPPLNRL
ncbi:GIY-YIG nuclease family protein [Actinotalea sp. M2MS4P-6]|uniref:GIY-YIG nuclease family protein n=1 Tax=Actinotalea sp. M2MS4P-6 TaxID=2983762 RepID=UPI00398C4299